MNTLDLKHDGGQRKASMRLLLAVLLLALTTFVTSGCAELQSEWQQGVDENRCWFSGYGGYGYWTYF
jgi:hypothetical protein